MVCLQSAVFMTTFASSNAMYTSSFEDELHMGGLSLMVGWNSTSWCPPDGPCEVKSCDVSDSEVYDHKVQHHPHDGYCTYDGAPVFLSEDSQDSYDWREKRRSWHFSFPQRHAPQSSGVAIMAGRSNGFVHGIPVDWCLTVDDSDPHHPSLLSIQYCDESPDQKFTLPAGAYDGNTSSSAYLGPILSSNGKCLEASPATGSAPTVRTCDGSEQQLWGSCRTVTETPNQHLVVHTNCHPAPAPALVGSSPAEPSSLAFV